MKPVYAALLPFAGDPLDDAPWRLVLQWVGLEADAPEDSDHPLADGETARVSSIEAEGGLVRRLDRRLAPREDVPAGWRTHVWVATDRKHCWAVIRSGPDNEPGFVTSSFYEAFRPWIVGDWIEQLRVVRDGVRLSTQALNTGLGDKEWLLDLLLSPSRHLPVIGISLPPDGSRQAAVNPHALARELAGNAHVAVLDRNLSWAITEELGQPLSVFNGAVRVWWPQLRPDDDPLRHTLTMSDRIDADPARFVRFLRSRVWRAAVDAIGPPAFEQRLRIQRDRARTEARLEAMRAESRSDEEFFAAFEEQLDRNTVLEEQLTEALTVADELREALAIAESGAEEVTHDEAPEADCVEDAVRIAASETSAVVYLPSAYESARESEYPNPQQVLQDLRALNRVADRWAQNSLPAGGFGAGFAEESVRFVPDIGQIAATKYESDYAIQFAGAKVLMRPHLRRGVGSPNKILRIYWHVDDRSHQLVVGHVGRKLRDQSNP